MKTIQAWRTKFSDHEDDPVTVREGRYGNGSTALQVFSAVGELLCTPTVNLGAYGMHPQSGNVFIKTYSENEGVLEALQVAGIVGDVIKRFTVGYVEDGAAEVPLLVEVGE